MADKKAEVEAKLAELHNWFKENSKLPEKIDPLLLRRFLKCMGNDVEATKKVIELNYDLRNKHPDIFLNRDPEDEDILRSFNVTDVIALPGLTPNRKKITLARLNDPDVSKADSFNEYRAFHLISDCRFVMHDTDESKADADLDAADDTLDDNLADGEIHIGDVSGYTISHIARISFSIARMHAKFIQEAYPMHLSEVHMINCPPFLNRMIALVRPFIRDEVFQRIHYHVEGMEILHEYVPRDMLPEEYGGKAGKIAEIKEKLIENIRERRDYLIDPKYWKVEKAAEPARIGWLFW